MSLMESDRSVYQDYLQHSRLKLKEFLTKSLWFRRQRVRQELVALDQRQDVTLGLSSMNLFLSSQCQLRGLELSGQGYRNDHSC